MPGDGCERKKLCAQGCEPKQLRDSIDDVVLPPSASTAVVELFDTSANDVGLNGSYNDNETRKLLAKAEIRQEPVSKFFDDHYDRAHGSGDEAKQSPEDSIPMACRTVRGASVLLVSLTDDGLNLPCVLLARERRARWLNNSNTHIYTDFGGSASDMIGRSPEYIAARELVEESAGVLRYFDDEALDHVEHLQDNIEASLLKGEYLAKFETPLNNRQKYVTFVKQVPWQPRISHLFRQTKKLLAKAQSDFSSLTESDKILVKGHPAVKIAAAGADADANVELDKAFFEKSDLKYFSLAFVQYYLDTGETHIVDSFKCMAYFKGRLRSATQIVGHLLQEAELMRLPPKFSAPPSTTSNMLSEEKPPSSKPKAKPNVVFVAGTPATGLDFDLVKNGIGNSQWRWKPKKRTAGDNPAPPDAERRRRRSEREHDNQRFRNGPLRSITERIGIDNKLRWTSGGDGGGRNVWGKRDNTASDTQTAPAASSPTPQRAQQEQRLTESGAETSHGTGSSTATENLSNSGGASKEAEESRLVNDDVDVAELDLAEVGGVNASGTKGGESKERAMDAKVGHEDLKENDMLVAISGGLGVQKTTDAGNRFTRAKQVNDEIYAVPMKDQMRCIVSVGGPTQHTKATSCYLRVAGFFPDEEDELEDHAEDLPRGNYLSSHAAVAYHVGSKEFENKEARQVYIDDQLARWDLKVLKKEARFDEHVDERSNFKDEEEEKAVDAKEKTTFAEQRKKRELTSRALRKSYEENKKKMSDKTTRKEMKKKKAKELKGSHALIDQSWMCIALMYDLDEEDLPIKKNWIYICWGAFPSKKIARGHISDTLQHDYGGMKHYVVKMYKWLPLDIVLTKEFKMKVKGIYKTDEQQTLWDGAHDAKPKAHQYKKKREEMERTAELKKMLQENKGMSTAELLKQQLEEDDEADVNVETTAETATTTTPAETETTATAETATTTTTAETETTATAETATTTTTAETETTATAETATTTTTAETETTATAAETAE